MKITVHFRTEYELGGDTLVTASSSQILIYERDGKNRYAFTVRLAKRERDVSQVQYLLSEVIGLLEGFVSGDASPGEPPNVITAIEHVEAELAA